MNKKKLIGVLDTLIMSWGSDTPPEAVWAANELLDFIESETNLKNLPRFTEEDPFSDLAKIQLELLTRNEHNYPCPVNWNEVPEIYNWVTVSLEEVNFHIGTVERLWVKFFFEKPRFAFFKKDSVTDFPEHWLWEPNKNDLSEFAALFCNVDKNEDRVKIKKHMVLPNSLFTKETYDNVIQSVGLQDVKNKAEVSKLLIWQRPE